MPREKIVERFRHAAKYERQQNSPIADLLDQVAKVLTLIHWKLIKLIDDDDRMVASKPLPPVIYCGFKRTGRVVDILDVPPIRNASSLERKRSNSQRRLDFC